VLNALTEMESEAGGFSALWVAQFEPSSNVSASRSRDAPEDARKERNIYAQTTILQWPSNSGVA